MTIMVSDFKLPAPCHFFGRETNKLRFAWNSAVCLFLKHMASGLLCYAGLQCRLQRIKLCLVTTTCKGPEGKTINCQAPLLRKIAMKIHTSWGPLMTFTCPCHALPKLSWTSQTRKKHKLELRNHLKQSKTTDTTRHMVSLLRSNSSKWLMSQKLIALVAAVGFANHSCLDQRCDT